MTLQAGVPPGGRGPFDREHVESRLRQHGAASAVWNWTGTRPEAHARWRARRRRAVHGAHGQSAQRERAAGRASDCFDANGGALGGR